MTNLKKIFTVIFGFAVLLITACDKEDVLINESEEDLNFIISDVSVTLNQETEQLVFRINTEGLAGQTYPDPIGQLDGAPVLGYVFPTDLKPSDVGFSPTEGILALALTSHPDFDDTPLWDENNDADKNNDGKVWHPHWVVLVNDERVSGGLSVKAFDTEDPNSFLPPTAPGMPMYMDSPGYPTTAEGDEIRVVVPVAAINGETDFNFDGVTAFMRVNTSQANLPMLGVYEVFNIASGDLSLPYSVK